MTDEQINQRIAEACGWEDCNGYIGKPPTKKMDQYNRSLPNYAGCLNAMHEAEKILMAYQQTATYSDKMIKIVGYGTFDSVHATARQKAEAFLKALGKWEEESMHSALAEIDKTYRTKNDGNQMRTVKEEQLQKENEDLIVERDEAIRSCQIWQKGHAELVAERDYLISLLEGQQFFADTKSNGKHQERH